MTALTADRKTVRKEGKMASYPVAASTQIFLGSLVCINGSGYAVPAANTNGFTFVGVAEEHADNSDGSAADIRVRVLRKGIHKMAATGLGLGDAGSALYITDDQTVQTSAANVRCGVLAQYESATVAPVDVEPAIELGDANVDQFTISAFFPGAVGHVAVTLKEDFELARAFRVLSAFADCQTAPGGAYVCTISCFGEDVTITGAATHGEDKAINADKVADTDYDITAVDDNASGATADVNVTIVCQWI